MKLNWYEAYLWYSSSHCKENGTFKRFSAARIDKKTLMYDVPEADDVPEFANAIRARRNEQARKQKEASK